MAMEIGSRQWHERRARSGGSSELPIILGCSPFASSDPLTLAWQKRGLIDAVADSDDEQRLIWEELEALWRKWLAHTLGCQRAITYPGVKE